MSFSKKLEKTSKLQKDILTENVLHFSKVKQFSIFTVPNLWTLFPSKILPIVLNDTIQENNQTISLSWPVLCYFSLIFITNKHPTKPVLTELIVELCQYWPIVWCILAVDISCAKLSKCLALRPNHALPACSFKQTIWEGVNLPMAKFAVKS